MCDIVVVEAVVAAAVVRGLAVTTMEISPEFSPLVTRLHCTVCIWCGVMSPKDARAHTIHTTVYLLQSLVSHSDTMSEQVGGRGTKTDYLHVWSKYKKKERGGNGKSCRLKRQEEMEGIIVRA